MAAAPSKPTHQSSLWAWWQASPSGRALLATSLGLLTLRLVAATQLGFGDAEALYATYARQLQPLYVDHPGGIGLLAFLLGGGGPPTPLRAHLATSVLSALFPFLGVWAAWCWGATPKQSQLTGWFFLTMPQAAIGLFGLTPDLPLALLWLGALGALGSKRDEQGQGSWPTFWLCVAAGCWFKVSAALLGLGGLVLGLRESRRNPRFWLGLAGATCLLLPLAYASYRMGFPMLRHRLIHTQGQAGFGLRNVGALLGGQLLYMGPLHFGLWLWALVKAPKNRTHQRLAWLCAPAMVGLGLLCLWSRVAEPHWFGPATFGPTLAIGPFVAQNEAAPGRCTAGRLFHGARRLGLVLIGAVHLWMQTPVRFHLPGNLYKPRYDLANDMLFWKDRSAPIRKALQQACNERARLLTPHYTLAAQLSLALPKACRVGTYLPPEDDFQRVFSPKLAEGRGRLVWVKDERFSDRPKPPGIGNAKPKKRQTITLIRNGRRLRTLELLSFLVHALQSFTGLGLNRNQRAQTVVVGQGHHH